MTKKTENTDWKNEKTEKGIEKQTETSKKLTEKTEKEKQTENREINLITEKLT